MTIHEPFVFLTDLLLAALGAGFGLRLLRLGRDLPATRRWAWALLLTAIGSLSGGVWHAVAPELPPFAATLLWKTTLFAIGGASAAMVAATAAATLRPRAGRWLLGAALAQLVVYLGWASVHDDFLGVVVDYGLAMLAVLVLHLRAMLHGAPGARRIVEAVVLSFAAAAIQRSPLALGPLDHNTLYHLVQGAALALFYLGARDGRHGAVRDPATSPLGSAA